MTNNNEDILFFVEFEKNSFIRLYSQIFNRGKGKEKIFVKFLKSLESLITVQIRKELQEKNINNIFETLNRVSFYLSSFQIFTGILEKIQKDFPLENLSIVENNYIELLVKYYQYEKKLIKYRINIFEWFNEIQMSFVQKEDFHEKLCNLINTSFNAEITKNGLNKLEKIVEKVFQLKFKLKL